MAKFLPKTWKFNEIGSVASIVGSILSVVALAFTLRPEWVPITRKEEEKK